MTNNQDLIVEIQRLLQGRGIEGWLFYGFRDVDPTVYQVLRFPPNPHITRRFFYLIPAQGEPRKLVHRIEPRELDHLPGGKRKYSRWSELDRELANLLHGIPRVAMQYSPKNANPYVSRVDGGTLEAVREQGVEILSSGDIRQLFEAVWSEKQIQQHRRTATGLGEIVLAAFEFAADQIRNQGWSDELAIQAFILDQFSERGWVADSSPIVGVNAHAGDPHYSPSVETNARLSSEDLLLIDLWAKPDEPSSVYADITWTAYYGANPSSRLLRVFETVRDARDRGVEFLTERIRAGQSVMGCEVDDEVRKVIDQVGYGQYFVHRTGHNLGQEVHGNGVHFDNLETHDTREVIPGIAATIEPGIYLPEFGIRSEINLYFPEGDVEVTTPLQMELLRY